MLTVVIAGAMLVNQASVQEGVKDPSGWTYYGEKIIREDRLLYHRRRTTYMEVLRSNKSGVPDDDTEDAMTVETMLTTSRLRLRQGFLGRSANGMWKLFNGPEWKGSRRIEETKEKKVPSSSTLKVRGGFTGIVFQKTIDEEWRDMIKLGNRLENREIFDRSEELIKVQIPAGSRFNTDTGEIEPVKPKS